MADGIGTVEHADVKQAEAVIGFPIAPVESNRAISRWVRTTPADAPPFLSLR